MRYDAARLRQSALRAQQRAGRRAILNRFAEQDARAEERRAILDRFSETAARPGSDGESLARHNAKTLNVLERSGEDITGEAEELIAELEGTGWSLVRTSGGWAAVADPEVETFTEHAPVGGITIGGTFFPGGRFITSQAMANASPEEKAKLEASKGQNEKAKQERVAKRSARQLDDKSAHSRLPGHAQAYHDLHGGSGPLDHRAVKAKAAALLGHHGDLSIHRIDEVAEKLEKSLHRAGADPAKKKVVLEQLAILHAAGERLKDRLAAPDYKKQQAKRVAAKQAAAPTPATVSPEEPRQPPSVSGAAAGMAPPGIPPSTPASTPPAARPAAVSPPAAASAGGTAPRPPAITSINELGLHQGEDRSVRDLAQKHGLDPVDLGWAVKQARSGDAHQQQTSGRSSTGNAEVSPKKIQEIAEGMAAKGKPGGVPSAAAPAAAAAPAPETPKGPSFEDVANNLEGKLKEANIRPADFKSDANFKSGKFREIYDRMLADHGIKREFDAEGSPTGAYKEFSDHMDRAERALRYAQDNDAYVQRSIPVDKTPTHPAAPEHFVAAKPSRHDNAQIPEQGRPKLAPKEKKAARDYAIDAFTINSDLRAGAFRNEEVKQQHEHLQKAFAKTPAFKEPVQTYRIVDTGTMDERAAKRLVDFYRQGAQSGEAFSDPAYLSTTTDPDMKALKEEFWGKEGSIEVAIAARHGLDLSPLADSTHNHVSELLLNAGSRYRVSGFSDEGGKIKVQLEQLSHEEPTGTGGQAGTANAPPADRPGDASRNVAGAGTAGAGASGEGTAPTGQSASAVTPTPAPAAPPVAPPPAEQPQPTAPVATAPATAEPENGSAPDVQALAASWEARPKFGVSGKIRAIATALPAGPVSTARWKEAVNAVSQPGVDAKVKVDATEVLKAAYDKADPAQRAEMDGSQAWQSLNQGGASAGASAERKGQIDDFFTKARPDKGNAVTEGGKTGMDSIRAAARALTAGKGIDAEELASRVAMRLTTNFNKQPGEEGALDPTRRDVPISQTAQNIFKDMLKEKANPRKTAGGQGGATAEEHQRPERSYGGASPEEEAIGNETSREDSARMEKAIASLGERDQAVFKHALQGTPGKEAAAQLGMSHDAYKQAKVRATQRIEKWLADNGHAEAADGPDESEKRPQGPGRAEETSPVGAAAQARGGRGGAREGGEPVPAAPAADGGQGRRGGGAAGTAGLSDEQTGAPVPGDSGPASPAAERATGKLKKPQPSSPDASPEQAKTPAALPPIDHAALLKAVQVAFPGARGLRGQSIAADVGDRELLIGIDRDKNTAHIDFDWQADAGEQGGDIPREQRRSSFEFARNLTNAVKQMGDKGIPISFDADDHHYAAYSRILSRAGYRQVSSEEGSSSGAGEHGWKSYVWMPTVPANSTHTPPSAAHSENPAESLRAPSLSRLTFPSRKNNLTKSAQIGYPNGLSSGLCPGHVITAASLFSESASADGLHRLRGVEVFATGEHRGKPYTKSDLYDIRDNFKRHCRESDPHATHRASMAIVPENMVAGATGHEETQKLQKYLERTDIPADGWVEDVDVRHSPTKEDPHRHVLLADLTHLSPETAHKIKRKQYRKVSAEIYPQARQGGIPDDRMALRRVSFLGFEPPQVKGLKDIPDPEPMSESDVRAWTTTIKFSEAVARSGAGPQTVFLFSEVTPMDDNGQILQHLESMGFDPGPLQSCPPEALAEIARVCEEMKKGGAPPPPPEGDEHAEHRFDESQPWPDAGSPEETQSMGEKCAKMYGYAERMKKYAETGMEKFGHKMAEAAPVSALTPAPKKMEDEPMKMSEGDFKKLIAQTVAAEINKAAPLLQKTLAQVHASNVERFMEEKDVMKRVPLAKRAEVTKRLLRANDTEVVETFAEKDGRKKTMTERALQMAEIRTWPAVGTGGPKSGVALTPDAKEEAAQRIRETYNAHHESFSEGTTAESLIKGYEAYIKNNPEGSLEDIIDPRILAAA